MDPHLTNKIVKALQDIQGTVVFASVTIFIGLLFNGCLSKGF